MTPGTAFAGGFYAGCFQALGSDFALVVSPKEAGEVEFAEWGECGTDTAATSYCDGRGNTKAMAEAGSELAAHVLALQIGEHSDWYLPSRDELELCYRNLKPTSTPSECSYRDGDNPSSLPPGLPYTKAMPQQSAQPEFQEGGAQAFALGWHLSSTQSDPDCALGQAFIDGLQTDDLKNLPALARAVRRVWLGKARRRVTPDAHTILIESALEKTRAAGEQMVFSLCHAAPALFDLHSPRCDLKGILDSVRCGLEHAIKAEPLWRETAASEGVTFANGSVWISRPSSPPVKYDPAQPSPDWSALHSLAKLAADANEYCQQIGLGKWGESATTSLIEDHKRMREALRLAQQGGEK